MDDCIDTSVVEGAAPAPPPGDVSALATTVIVFRFPAAFTATLHCRL
jgi:hypothetical protein